MNSIRIISDDDVESILDLKNTILCVENAYRQKANKLATILPLVSADLVEGKADMDIKSGIYQAVFQIAATLTAVPTIRKVYLYSSRNEEKARLFQKTISTQLGRIRNDIYDLKNRKWIQRIETVEFSAVNNIESALNETDAVITITPSRQALIRKEWVKPGTHFSCIRADLPGKQELDETLFETVRVFVDDVGQASKVGEIQTAVRLGMLQKESITEIGDVINENQKGRLSNKDITVFDSTGIALQDLAVSDYLLKIAKEKNIGTIVNL